MSLASADLAPSAWEEAGHRAAAALNSCSSVVVVGPDAAASALTALGIGRAQAQRRRVAICDLVGEDEALRHLVPPDAIHGLLDHILFGVSRERVAYPIDGSDRVRILPSGPGPIEHEALLSDERWRTLLRKLQESDTLVLIVAPPRAAQLSSLSSSVDGAVVVGDLDPGHLSVPVLETVHATRPSMSRDPRSVAITPEYPIRRRRAWWFAAGAALLAAGAIGVLLTTGVVRWPIASRATQPEERSAVGAGAVSDDLPKEPSDASPQLAVANPWDSGIAAAFVVEVMAINSQAAADSQLARHIAQGFPANTVTPLLLGAENARWYRLTAGAFRERAQAEAFIRALRSRGDLQRETGRVLLAPYTLLIRSDVATEDVPDALRSLRARGWPVYALLQPDGTARVFAGAFETPSQAADLLSMFPADSVRPPVVYRVGRVF